jgi:drug/metabolite transporter (DMT)-like permease
LQGIIGAALAVSLLWGSGWLFMKVSMTSFPPFLFAGVRGVLAGLVLLALVRWQGQKWPRRRDLAPMIAVGVLMTGVSNGITFWGQARISSSLAALVWCSMPFFTAIFSHFLLAGQKLNAWRVGGLLLGFSGVWLVLNTQQLDVGAGVTEGKVAVMVSAALWALALNLNKKLLPGANAMMMTGVQLLAGGVFLVPLSLLTERGAAVNVTPVSTLVFLIMLFGQGVTAYYCYYYLMSKVSPTSVALLSFVTPSIAVVLGVILLGEAPYWQMGAGLALVAAGILIVNMLGQREQAIA